MKYLKHLDIQNADEEQMVQKVLNTRLKDAPMGAPLVFPSHMTDNMTIEKEQALQAKIDARNAQIKSQFAPLDEVPQVDAEPQPLPDPTESIPDAPAEEGRVEPIEDEPLMPEVEPEEEEESPTVDQTKTAFCLYCDSLGVRHKKVCTRPDKQL